MIRFVLLSMLAANPSDPFVQDQIDLQVRRVLEDESFGFCHDPQYPLTEEEAGWCPMASELVGRCPSFASACGAPRARLSGGSGQFSRRTVESDDEKGSRSNGRGRQGEGPQREPEESKSDKHEPERRETTVEVPSLGGLAELLFWGILIVGVIALVVAILKNLGPARQRDEDVPQPETEDEDEDETGAAAAAAARRAMETDVDRLLELSDRAAAKGEFAAAVDYAHAALLRRLDHDGLIRLHHARTNGDYLRDLRRHPDLAGSVAQVLRQVDRAQFGGRVPDAGVWGEIVQRVRTLVRSGGSILSVWLLLALFVGCDEPSGVKSYPWPTSPSGTEALVQVLSHRGKEVRDASAGLPEQDEAFDTVVLLLEDTKLTPDEWEQLDPWVRNGGTIIATGQTPPFVDGIGLGVALDKSESSQPLLVGSDYLAEVGVPMVFAPDLPELWVNAGTTHRPLLSRQKRPYAVEVDHGAGKVLMFAGDDVFTNASMAAGDNAIFVVGLLESRGRRFVLVDAWTSAGAASPMDSIRRSHLTPAMLQLLALLALLYLWRGVPFGKPRDPAPPSRRSFTQHARAMSLQYAKGRAAGHAGAVYAAWILDRLRDRYPTAARGGLLPLAQLVARKSGRDETEVMRLLVEAHGAAEAAAAGRSDGADLRLVRELGALVREIGGTT